VSHQALMVGHASISPRRRATPRTTTSPAAVVLAAMHAAGAYRLLLAGSMVIYGEDRYDCAEHGPVSPGPRAPACSRSGSSRSGHTPTISARHASTWTPGGVRAALPAVRLRSRARTCRGGRPPRPCSTYAATTAAQESWSRRGRGRTAGRRGRCASTTSVGRGCRATPRTPASRRSSGRRWSAATRPRGQGRGPAPRLPPHRRPPRAAEVRRVHPLEEPAVDPGGALRCGRLNRAALGTARSRQRPRCRERSR
jgi:hypothetical protein